MPQLMHKNRNEEDHDEDQDDNARILSCLRKSRSEYNGQNKESRVYPHREAQEVESEIVIASGWFV